MNGQQRVNSIQRLLKKNIRNQNLNRQLQYFVRKQIDKVNKMSSDQTENFRGITSCLPSFDDCSCFTKVIQFSLSCVLFITGLGILYQYLRFFGFKDKIYINLALFSMAGYLAINMLYCFWNNLYYLYSLQTFLHNMYFLAIVVYTTKSYLLKQSPKSTLLLSRVSELSNDSVNESSSGFITIIRNRILNNIKFYKFLYKTMTIVFLLLFSLIFVTSLIGDIKSKQHGENLAEDQGQQTDFTLFSFVKNSCEQLWYLCVNAVSVVLSLIVLLVLYKNYSFEQERIKALTLVTATVHERQAPFSFRDSKSLSDSQKMGKNISSTQRFHNPLRKLAFWMGLNVFGEIVNLIESGLLLQADPMGQCMIIPNDQRANSILKLIFVIGSVYVQYSISLWFFYDTLRQKLHIDYKSEKRFIEAHQYSEEIRVGQIQLNPSLKTSSSGSD